MIKILFLVPSLTRAGAEKQVVDLANGLPSDKFDIHLASFESNRDQLERLNEQKVTYHPFTRSTKYDWSLTRQISKTIDKESIDVLHCTLSIAIFYGVISGRWSKRRPIIIAGVHTTISRTRKDEFLERWLYRWQLRSASRVVFVCHRQKEYWWKRDPKLIPMSLVTYNGVDTSYFNQDVVAQKADELRKQLEISPDTPVCCCIAAFRPEKAQGNILRALSLLPSSLNDTKLILAGDGVERKSVEGLAEELGLSHRIHFLGSISDVRPVLAISDFSIISSIAVETFSFAMLESMSMGTPVLSSRIGGADEAVISGETGYLVEPGNVEELSETMKNLMTDRPKTQQMGVCARIKVEEMFSMETMIQETADLLTTVVEE